jgi:hypothetical protein
MSTLAVSRSSEYDSDKLTLKNGMYMQTPSGAAQACDDEDDIVKFTPVLKSEYFFTEYVHDVHTLYTSLPTPVRVLAIVYVIQTCP